MALHCSVPPVWDWLAGRVDEDFVVGVEDAGGHVGALEIFADLDEVPVLAVGHGAVGDALEKMRGVFDLR